MHSSWSITCTALSLGLSTLAGAGAATTRRQPSITFDGPAKVPPAASNIVPHDFSSFSFPAHFFADFAGNHSNPNLFSKDILDLLANKTGAQPFIRVGGTSTDRVWYNTSQEQASINQYDTSTLTGNIGIPERVDIGPSFFEGFDTFPDTPWSWQINMGQTYGVKGGKENAMQVAKLVLERVQDRLESFEIGNEPDLMYLVGHRPENYTVADYVWEWNEYADAASEQVLNANPYGLDETRFFQAGTITEYYDWTVQQLLDSGIDDHNHTKSISVHHYDGSGQSWIRLGSSLMNHTNIASNVSSELANIAFAKAWSPTLPFVLGETNSDASNLNFTQVIGVFGSALWLIDRTFLSMAANMRRQNLIQGTTFGYTAWVPVPTDGRDPYVRPPLYGQIFTADAIGTHPEVQVYPMPASTAKFVAHAIYESRKLARYALINFEEWNSTMAYARPVQRVQLAVPESVAGVQIERLTAAGASADEGIAWAGQSWNYTDGRLARHGERSVESVETRNGVVTLSMQATEAVLVTLVYT